MNLTRNETVVMFGPARSSASQLSARKKNE